jgi:carboxyl-terminal processing protease
MRRSLAFLCVFLCCGALLVADGHRAPQPRPPSPEALAYAQRVLVLTQTVADQYVRPVSRADLILAALTGLYEAARLPLPRTLPDDLRKASADGDLLLFLARTRDSLTEGEPLPGNEALLASCRGLTRVLDPHSCLVSGEELRRSRGVDQQHGIGVELIENLGVGPLVIKTVYPGGPAQKAGLRPGDAITHVDGKSVAGLTADQVQADFRKNLLVASMAIEPASFNNDPDLVQLTVQRADVKTPWEVSLERQSFKPETVLGVMRQDDNSWDYLLDRERKLAHVRVANLGTGTADELEDVLKGLRSAGVRGLILDLRWCPGGYLNEAVEVASQFLGDCVIATVKARTQEDRPYLSSAERPVKLLDLPLVVLVNGETSGGAELIAAALQDHKRAAVAGQRTLGKASVQSPLDIGVQGLGMKLTSGTFVRPSGKNLHRFPESGPADVWGVRPEPKLEFRMSPELTREVRDGWQRQTLRPGTSRERLPLDDPAADPQRQAALQALRDLVK